MRSVARVRPEPRREEAFRRGHEAIRVRDDHALRRWDDHAERCEESRDGLWDPNEDEA
jgi:hypothetical protein